MSPIKRQSDGNESLMMGTKKLRPPSTEENISITCIENLSNELFYEIFEYLDGCDIYKAFFKLNSRFQRLITNSLLPLKIELASETKLEMINCCKNIIIPNKHRIVSFYLENDLLINDFFTHCIIDSSFSRLESIVLCGVSIDTSMILLFYLKSLSRLFSLTMHIDEQGTSHLNSIYRMIFSLPSLKYNRLSLPSRSGDENTNVLVPLAINEQFSTIEYLIINHDCTVDELLSMLYHTPRLRHLTCQHLKDSNTSISTKQPVILSNLTYVRITCPPIMFDDFEMFMIKICGKVQVLIISNFFDETCFDADRWERLIINHIPHLRRLDFIYDTYFQTYSQDMSSFNGLINRFTSPFWVQRQWFFELVIDNIVTNCAIYPYRNIWRDIYKYAEIATYFNQNLDYNFTEYITMSNRQDTDKSATQCLPFIQLSINTIASDELYQSFIDKFTSTFAAVQFTHLKINCENIPIEMLVRIIHLLPHLDSLIISSLPLIQPGWLFDGDAETRFLTSISNKITTVNLEKMIHIEQLHFLLYLCPRIQYFQMDILDEMDFEILVRFILIKSTTYIPQLCSLCLTNSNVNDEIVHRLQKMIESEKLLTNYMITRICNNILLKWN